MDDALKHHLIQARELYEQREYDRAEPHLRDVLKLTQGYADVYNMLGVIAHDRGDFQEARKQFEQATQINPNYTEAALNLAVTYNDLGLYREARETYEQMRKRTVAGEKQLDPFARGKLANMHADVAQAYTEFGLFNDAAVEYRKALTLSPQFADLRTRYGNVLREAGDMNGAIEAYGMALASNPKYVAAHVVLGVTYFSLGRKAEAEAQWTEAARLDPENKSAQMYLRMARGKVMQSQPPPRPSTTGMHAVAIAESRPDIQAPPPDRSDAHEGPKKKV